MTTASSPFKLYFSPGACSLSPHIALREAGLPFSLVRVDFSKGRATDDGQHLADVNPKNYVPALVLPSGETLTEGAVIIQYIADQVPDKQLAPPPGSFERFRLQEWLNFLATELHKGFSPLYSPDANPAYKDAVKKRIDLRMEHLVRGVGERPFLMGDRFTVADGYALYNLRSYRKHVRPELPEPLVAYHDRIVARPAVQAAFAAEGIA
jgi:glutathione S-transferase